MSVDHAIEAAAKAMHSYEEEGLGRLPWETLPPDQQEYWIKHARIAFAAFKEIT